MEKLWLSLTQNLDFVAVCFAILAGLYALARLLERFAPAKRQLSAARRISILAICGALAWLLMLLEFPVVFLAPGFYKLDFSELPIMLCGFYLGPSAAVACEGLKVILNLLTDGTTTAFVGEFANFTVGCSLVLPAAILYRYHNSRKGAIWGLVAGSVCITVFGSMFNAFYLLPKFSQLYGIPLGAILAMGTAINPAIDSVGSFVLLAVVPLNIIKALCVGGLTMLLYKRVARPLFQK